MIKKFRSKGLAYGKYWGGGEGAYQAEELTGETKEELLEKANTMLTDGSLDSGMGYESLIGAILDVSTIMISHLSKWNF